MNFDQQITTWIFDNLHNQQWLNETMKIFSYLGEGGAIWLTIIIFSLVFVLVKFKKISLFLSFSLLMILTFYLLNDFGLKLLIKRPRPFYELEDIPVFLEEIHYSLPGSYSMPSGHAANGTLCATLLFFYNKKFGFFTFPLILLIAFSRIYLGVHYFTDVLVGISLGALFASIYYIIYIKVISKKLGATKYAIR